MKTTIGIATCVAAVGLGYAAVIIDDDGFGFVGKGDAQLVMGWNNAQLQKNADNVRFRTIVVEKTSQESTWTCDKDAGSQTRERSNTVTTTTTAGGVLASVARVRNQVTGFNLNGFGEDSETSSGEPETDGPAVGSCPTFWTAINLVTGDPVTEIIEEGLDVSDDGGETWFPLPITPEEEL